MADRALKYARVRDHLRALATDELAVGDAVPSERLLCEQFGVSRMTVRQAVDALVAEGLLAREQGRGTFVAPRPLDVAVRLTSFGEEMRRRGMVPSSQVLQVHTVPAAADVAEALDLLTGERVHHLHRVRLADDVPMAVEHLWVPATLAPDLLADGAPDSVYEAMRSRGLSPEWGEDVVGAGEADDEEGRHLGLGPGRAVLRVARRTFAGQTAYVYSRSSYRADRYSLWVPVRAPEPVVVPRARTADATTGLPTP